jgi:nucleotide-binding universal stress UspA family protein
MLKLLLPVDGSDNALRAVKHALDTRTWYRDLPEYYLLNVQLPVASGAVKMFISQQQLDDYYQEEGAARLAAARELLKSAGVICHARVAVGEIDGCIVRHAKELEASLIVMGTRGMGAVRNLVLGSVAAKVIHLSEVPVLLIR